MDMHAAAAIVWDKQTKTGGRQVRWIETTKAKPLERCGKRRLVLYLFDDDLDIKDIAGRHPRYCRRADVLRHHVRDILRQDNGQSVEVTPPVIAMANDPIGRYRVLDCVLEQGGGVAGERPAYCSR